MNFQLSDEVAASLRSNQPVVALESTVISHGLPYPQNLETARRLEAIVRENGAVPATIAVLKGGIRVGITDAEIEFLATSKNIRKISRRDLAIAAAKNIDSATTVATTSFIANKAGIKVFATGGIGGVHRGYSTDVSADLIELARTPIVVVCSGPKIVLDLPATREWLETFGITVLGWQCDEMPAFYVRSSGLAVDERVESAVEVAQIVRARDALDLTNGIVVTVPVTSKAEIDAEELEKLLAELVRAANDQNITGKNVTPFLLRELATRTGGRTLTSNIALLENNASIAAEIAKALV